METKPHRARVFKDPDHWPGWQVYYGGHLGRVIAHAAAKITLSVARSICEHSLTGWRIIREVNRLLEDFNVGAMWVPGSPAITHTAHLEYMREHGRRHQVQHQGGRVIFQWMILAA